ncbi:PAS domain S-box protein [Ferruginibacter lapsinanis]|uniref:PAS domain-containing sensor histidine kinase n=1 Tax=Ferruginibacter lapsinanis TaxID=563172 RepID=UPI001E2DC8C3|nr:PAS domain-containing protein [Ferruginibacter lapsinanis]UEG51231.1 PAS domain S-box protein [Ferruginibacter lapsinanis]
MIDFKKLFEEAPGLYLILNPELRIVEASNAYLIATMTDRMEIIGRDLFEVFPDNPDDATADGVSNLRNSLNYVLKNHIPHAMSVQKYDIRKPDGVFEERYWSPYNKPVFNEKREVIYIIHNVQDVTDLMRLQNAREDLDNENKVLLIQNEEKDRRTTELNIAYKEISDYKYALDESSIVAITDHKGIINHVNDNFCKISQYSREELIGQDHRIINSGFHSKEFIRTIWVTIANGNIWRGELKNKAKDGSFYWVDTTIIPFLNEQKKPYQYVAIRADITSRKLTEENLEKSLREISDYKYALNESSIVAITDQKGIIKYANYNFCKISKFSYEELIGQDHRIINSGYHPKDFIRNLWVTIANGKIWRGELKNKAKDGTFYWVDTTIVPFLNEAGRPYQYVAIRADITQRKQAEEEIKVLNEELETRVKERTEELESFSYSVSHDLRAPLRAVNGYARMLEEDYKHLFDEEGKRLLGEVQRNAKKMGVLIDDLLSFSRLGRKEINKSVIEMNDLVTAAIKEIQQTGEIQAQIKYNNLISVKADYTLMLHVMINLISNALKYSAKNKNPIVEIRCKREKDDLVYSVSDNGVGFDMEYIGKLFGVFQRLHSADEFPGTGVGLAIVQRIIHKHKGRVWAEGKVGKGAVFYFSLPEN